MEEKSNTRFLKRNITKTKIIAEEAFRYEEWETSKRMDNNNLYNSELYFEVPAVSEETQDDKLRTSYMKSIETPGKKNEQLFRNRVRMRNKRRLERCTVGSGSEKDTKRKFSKEEIKISEKAYSAGCYDNNEDEDSNIKEVETKNDLEETELKSMKHERREQNRKRMMKMREDESLDDRKRRLLKNRVRTAEWKRRKRMKDSNNDFDEKVFQCCFTYGNLKSTKIEKEVESDSGDGSSDFDMSDTFLDSEYEDCRSFEQVNDQLKSKIFNSCQRDIVGSFMNQDVCSVCDMILELNKLKWATVTQTFAKKCNEKLRPCQNLSFQLKNYYSISHIIPQLDQALLSPRSTVKEGKHFSIRVCYSCFDSLSRKSSGNIPPKFAIANGFEIGELPSEIDSPTQPEICLTSLTSYSPPVSILKGGKHRSLKKHVTVFDNNPFDIVEKIK